jgi:hypothetical protein
MSKLDGKDKMAAACDVCYEKINKRNKEIVCIHCEFSACTNCCKKYILGSVNDARCMKCSKNWNRDFLVDKFSYSFINTSYKKHREQIIFEKQLSMMTETQKVIERRDKVNEIDKLMRQYKDQINEIKGKIYRLSQEKYKIENGKSAEVEEVVKFFGHCPKENCRGFINSSWNCGICKTKVCKSCKEEIAEESDDSASAKHECNPEILESLSKIKRDSKPCPKCKSMIYRIEGCAQMHCTMCHTNYNWQTGEIVTKGVFHNPHYIEWQQTHGGGVVNQNNCGDDLFERIQIYVLEKAMACDVYKKRFVIEFIRFMYHIYDIELYEFRHQNADNCLNLRITYLKNYISEEEFKKKLQQYEKKENKKNEVSLVFDMLYNTGKSIVLQLIMDNTVMKKVVNEENTVGTIKQINELIEYTNESMAKISKKYKNKVPFVKLPQNLDARGTFSII